MRFSHCIFAFFLTTAIVLSMYGAVDRWNAVTTGAVTTGAVTTGAITESQQTGQPKERFENPGINQETLRALQLQQNPTDADAVQAHKTLLRYTQDNYPKGVSIILNISRQFFGPGLSVRKDLDPATLLANYTNPLVGI